MEIERKFLVTSRDYKKEAYNTIKISQGYLNSHPERTVRVRISDQLAFITIKGKSSQSGLSRYEWEKEIPLNEAKQLMTLSEPGAIEKLRYLVKAENHVFEIDEFTGANEGLVIAEVELKHEEEEFMKPSWLGKEVTGEKKYYNSQLSQNPYKYWKKQEL